MSLTREKILELGEELLLKNGYNAFSYQDISSELGIKNAAIHYYFPAKENLGTGIVKTNMLRFEEMTENMRARNFSEKQQLDTFIKIYVKSNRENKLCLMGSLGPAYYTLNESTQMELRKMTDMIVQWLSSILESGREKGIFAFRGYPRGRALMILTNMIAGLQLSRILEKSDFKTIQHTVLEDLIPAK